MTDDVRPRVLVVDDEPSVCRSCEKILVREGFEVSTVLSGKAALRILDQESFDLLFTDLKMVEVGGLELLEALRTRFPDIVAVVITGYATISSVVETMKLGAFDYLPKPFTPEEMAAVASKAWDKRKLILEARAPDERGLSTHFAGIVGKSLQMQEVFRLIRKVAPTSSTVLIVGESGTGKELVAGAIHTLSPRKNEKFIAVDCGALSVGVLESELFGHVRGAFTGAVSTKQGIFEAADRGTVFLDEICNVDTEIQAKLLRFVQEREFTPVGGIAPRHVDVRLIFATNRDLAKMLSEGTFREDLYYRLHVFPISLPPLRSRREDIPLLAHRLLAKVSQRTAKSVSSIADDALKLLEDAEWPGNVRELESTIEAAIICCDGDQIEPRHLPKAITGRGGLPAAEPVPKTNRELVALKKKMRAQAVTEIEREFVVSALENTGWNVTKAALAVGMQRPNFQALMRKHGVRREG